MPNDLQKNLGSILWAPPSPDIITILRFNRLFISLELGKSFFRKAVELDDNLRYEEPWSWPVPTRHALGALLLEAGEYDEAEAVYRADLGLDEKLPRPSQHPKNVWALHGLHECLRNKKDKTELPHVALLLQQAEARADIKIRASCLCRGE